ncbi:apolipoprotein N-acyltransferase [Rhodococcus aerolatus]
MRTLLTGPVLLRVLASLAGGYALYLSFPPRHVWWLAPLGIAAVALALRGVRVRAGFGYGYLAGAAFLLPLIPWVGEYVGPVPWLALALVEALFVGLFGAVGAAVGRLPAGPFWVACTWVAAESLRSYVPFGGFPWGRLAFGQPDGLLLPLASVGGPTLLSFGVALTGTGLAALLVSLRRRRALTAAGALLATVVPLAGALALGPATRAADTSDRTLTVAAVQGNVPRLGLEFNSQRRAVLDNHVARTLQLAADVAAGRVPRPDVVIWPENSADVDPLRNPDAGAVIDEAARAIGVPILVGAVLVGPDRTTTNSVIVWDPVTGPGQQHDKTILQPFGEYLPYRSFFSLFSSYADKAGYFVPGDDDGVLTAAGVPVAVSTCWEVAFDRQLRTAVRDGGQYIAVPTNNATFGRTEMTYQQLAMSRVRAVEHGRAVVVAATSGISAVVAPDGSVTQATQFFTPAALVSQVPLHTTTTVATRIGEAPELALAALTLAALGWSVLRRRRTGDPAGQTTDDARPAPGREEDTDGGAGAPGRVGTGRS